MSSSKGIASMCLVVASEQSDTLSAMDVRPVKLCKTCASPRGCGSVYLRNTIPLRSCESSTLQLS